MAKDAAYYRAYRAKTRGSRPVAPPRSQEEQRLRTNEYAARYVRKRRALDPDYNDDSKFGRAEFIAWDGEGYTDARGNHRYFLLGWYHRDGESGFLENAAGIDTEAAFDFLLSVAAKYPHAIHVCYGASYDCNMILKDLDWNTLERLWKNDGGKRVDWNGYQLVYQQRKCLTLSRGKHSITLWDVIGFYQTTFVRTIREHLGDEYSALPVIESGKQRRSQFDISERDNIRAYTCEELKALILVMQKLHGYIAQCGIKLARWDGAGAIAAALLRKHGVKAHMAECPPEVQRAARHAYFGGRAEMMQYGYGDRPIYHYDINSAYPTALQHLPSLHGRWQRREGHTTDREPFSISRVQWRFTNTDNNVPFYPLPFRDDDGSIYFPSSGEGWYWEPEISATLDTLERYVTEPQDTFEILETWNFYPDTAEKPFEFVPELYHLRKSWKASGIQAQYALKLGLNSIYGKLAQQVGGWTSGGKITKPAYHQLEWAGWVTSYARAHLLRAMAQHPQAVVMVATDGIYATEPLELGIGGNLGDWEFNHHDAIVVVQSGVYWVNNTGAEYYQKWLKEHKSTISYQEWLDGGYSWTSYRRGFDDGSLPLPNILESWKHGSITYQGTCTRFLTLGSGIYNKNLRSLWRTWRENVPRELSLIPEGKRTRTTGVAKPWLRLEPTEPTMIDTTAISRVFPLRWGVSLDAADAYSTVDGVPQRVAEGEMEDSIA